MKPDGSVAVAYSGGRDSTALLHATLMAAAPLGCTVVALHVHHGLSPNADGWLAHCEQQVVRWRQQGHAVSLACERLVGRPGPGDSIEAWARKARYRALQRMAKAAGADLVLLAHHRRDQAETFVLQALRGAGVAGLSGMPQRVGRDGLVWCRPWLQRPREDIEAYLERHRLSFIDDDSNEDRRYARNRLRLAVWPALAEAFPQAESSLADAATWAQQATACLQELAALDLAAIADARDGGTIAIDRWLALSPARRGNALRAWLHRQQGSPAPATLVLRLLGELPKAIDARWPAPGGQLHLHRRRLSWRAVSAAEGPSTAAALQHSLVVRRAGRYALAGWGGHLRITRVREGGVPFAWLGQLELRPRRGGEQFQAGVGRPARSLKKQFQSAAVPEWLRTGPLVYSGGQLVYVPGLGIDARVLALPGQPQARIEWLPLTPSTPAASAPP